MDDAESLEIFDPRELRRELFKLYYVDDLFGLYDSADCFEAIDKMLTILHHWCSGTQMPTSINKIAVPQNLCVGSKSGMCFVHEKFFMNRTV